MAKRILILYRAEDRGIVSNISSILSDTDYQVYFMEKYAPELYTVIQNIRPSEFELAITVNAYGFESRNVDGGSYFNNTPVNIVSILTEPAETYHEQLNQRINYTVIFLVKTENDVAWFRSNLPHIHQVFKLPELSALPDFLKHMDWRF